MRAAGITGAILLIAFGLLTMFMPADAGAQSRDRYSCPSAAPTLDAPVFGDRVDLEWIGEGRTYEYEIRHEDGFQVARDVTTSEHGDSRYLPPGHYFARVRNRDCVNHPGNWSRETAFTIMNQNPPNDSTPQPPAEQPSPAPCTPGTGECSGWGRS